MQRPDSAFALSVLGRFPSNPDLAYWNAGKKVFEKDTVVCIVLHLCWQFRLICHKDADLGGCVDDRMSTSSNIFMLAGEALSR